MAKYGKQSLGLMPSWGKASGSGPNQNAYGNRTQAALTGKEKQPKPGPGHNVDIKAQKGIKTAMPPGFSAFDRKNNAALGPGHKHKTVA